MSLPALLAAAALAPPTASDIQGAETARVLTPLISYARDGRAFVEFAPTVETRGVDCEATETPRTFHCVYEARERPALSRDFGAWEVRDEMVAFGRKAGWTVLAPQVGEEAAIRRACRAMRRQEPWYEIRCSELRAVRSGMQWIVSEPVPDDQLDGGINAVLDARDGRVIRVWING